jgi:hypothetical protein
MRISAMAALAVSLAAPVGAANLREEHERALKQFFEGRSVTVWIDMPATSSGIDVRVGREDILDFSKLQSRVGGSGVAIHEGQSVRVTKVVVKDDLIEFQLAGGGFNSIWNGSGTVSPTYVGKSSREKDLEDEIRREDDPKRKRDLQRQLDRERDRRRREEQQSREIADATNEIRRERDSARALGMGSRFNIRFDKQVPLQAATPDGVMEVLAPWVDFTALPGGAAYARPRNARAAAPGPEGGGAEEGGLHPGLSRSQVANLLGPAEHEQTSNDGNLHKAVGVFHDGGQKLELTFVNGILVQIRELP